MMISHDKPDFELYRNGNRCPANNTGDLRYLEQIILFYTSTKWNLIRFFSENEEVILA